MSDDNLLGVPELGDRVADKVTGWKGVVIAETRYLFGGRTLTMESEDVEDIRKDTITVGANRLQVVDKAVLGPNTREKA